MRIIKITIATVLLLSATVATAAPADENSIKQLLAITQAQKLVAGMLNQVDAMMSMSIQQALKGKVPNPGEQQAINNMKDKMVVLIHGDLAWDKVEPMYIRLYKDTFTEEEVAGMLAFYKTPAGQAVIQKMPVLMQKSMFEVQNMLSQDRPKIQKIQQDFLVELKAANKGTGN
ncbi:DUF2059 domain-containing protein [Sulfuriferula nivalis]|uniref:DUF2059 domain-containing protein n=1 Tax=Sulfuriferula nivalis TaxID=2675298 RepID=A0A809SAY6_9PROT|nr:DUF2059 domain-containing protein [Sulfuriferula nivalis]BBP02333.1 hypothetical protein SFSGTM_30410 [Sulfuriferula nivalis]